MPEVWVLVAVLAILLVLVAFGWWWERGRAGRRSRSRLRVARAGEDAAERLLEDHGFAILDRQVAADWTVEVDGVANTVSCRVDLLVERDGQLFAAEVKTGGLAPDPLRPATRRQLLEYTMVFDVDGVLLVDMSRGELKSIRLLLGEPE